MLFDFGRGSGATVFGVEVWGKYRGSWWHKIAIMPIYRIGRRIREAVMWLRYRFDKQHRYHVIDTGLPPGYHDVDVLILHGMFRLLCRYVEDEHGGVVELEAWAGQLLAESRDDGLAGHLNRQGEKEAEAARLYRWWTEARPEMCRRRDELSRLLYGKGRCVLEETDLGKVMTFRPFQGQEREWDIELDLLEETIWREEQEMLHRLIEIRGALWT